MTIKNLKDTPLETIVNCLSISFADYFVKMPDDVTFWKNRWEAARVDYALSYGVFNKDQLVAFIMHGIDELDGELTAFNTGTGVIPSFRGQQLVDKIYDHAIPHLKEKGVTQCTLEVIQNNDRAIRVYQRIGFSQTRSLKCFKGQFQPGTPQVSLQEVPFSKVQPYTLTNQAYYAWDNTNKAITLASDQYKSYLVSADDDSLIGYFIVNPSSGYVAQLELINGDFKNLMTGLTQVATDVRMNNVASERKEYVENLFETNWSNHIDQFEMKMKLTD